MDDKTLIQSSPEPDPRSGNNEGGDKTIMQPGNPQDNYKTLYQPNALPPQQGYAANEKTLFTATPPPNGDKTMLQSGGDATSVWGDRNNDNIPDFITNPPPPTAQAAPPKKKDWTSLILGIGGILFILCICCLIVVAGYMIFSDPNALAFMSTATPTLAPTATPAPTRTPSPTEESTQTVEPTLAINPLIDNASFVEEFNDNSNGWSEGDFSDEYGDISFEFVDGFMRWTVNAAQPVNQKDWASEAPTLKDFTLSVDVQKTSGAKDSAYGLIFRVVDNDNFYYFRVIDHVEYKQYSVSRLLDNEWTTLIDWTDSSVIKAGKINTLKVVADGDMFTLYINNKEVDSFVDDTLAQGTAGLAVELYTAGDEGIFEFDNFEFSSP